MNDKVNSIHLQGMGLHYAKPASELVIGDVLVWNYGYTSTLHAFGKGTPKMLDIIVKEPDGKLNERRFARTRLVAVRKPKRPAQEPDLMDRFIKWISE